MACHVNVIECRIDKLDTTKDYVATFKLDEHFLRVESSTRKC